MSKFTPGPWKVYKRAEPVGHAAYEIHYSEDGECVAEVVHEEADALLIAAAPEMYQALEHIVEYWNKAENEYAMADALYHIIETAETAITKAGGSE